MTSTASMKPACLILFFLSLFSFPIPSLMNDGPQFTDHSPLFLAYLNAQSDRAQMAKINELYKQAMNLFKEKEYLKAIKIWENILGLDPKQKIPKKMIDTARDLVKESINPILKEASLLVESGDYGRAYEKYRYLLTLDGTNPKAKSASAKLEIVIKSWKEIDDLEPYSPLLMRSLTEFSDPGGDLRLTLIGFIYLAQKYPDEPRISEFHEYLKMNFPDSYLLEKPVPGINILEQKINGARYSIEDGKFDLAIKNCNDALFIEENNVVALARLGTSYYLLGKMSRAKEIWKKALAIDPNHESSRTIKEFLSKIK